MKKNSVKIIGLTIILIVVSGFAIWFSFPNDHTVYEEHTGTLIDIRYVDAWVNGWYTLIFDGKEYNCFNNEILTGKIKLPVIGENITLQLHRTSNKFDSINKKIFYIDSITINKE